MMQAIRKRIDDDKGFTLIELMVVVLIIAILIAIAIPTFLGLRERAQNRAAQSDLRNGLTAAKAWFTDGDTYNNFNAAEGEAIEPSLNWVAGTVASDQTNLAVSVDVAVTTTNSSVGLARQSASGVCFYMTDYSDGGSFRNSDDTAACTGAQALTYTGNDDTW